MKKTQLRPFILCTVTLLIAVLLASCQSLPVQANDSLKRLQGRWVGKGPGGDCALTISGDSLRFFSRDDHWYRTTFTLPDGTEPKQLRATIVDAAAPGQGHIGKVVLAIFEVEGDFLRLATGEDPHVPEDGDAWERYRDQYELKRVE